MKTTVFAAAALVAVSPFPAGAAAEIEPGLWEVVVKTSGIMGMGQNTYVNKTCYRPEDLMKPENFTPDLAMPEMQCTKGNFTQSGGTLTWKVSCQGNGLAMDGTGTFESKGPEAYDGLVKMKMRVDGIPQMGGLGVEMTTTYAGRRVGPCVE